MVLGIAIDIDDVLTPCMQTFLDWNKRKYNRGGDVKKFHSYEDWEKSLGLRRHQADFRVEEFITSYEFKTLKPFNPLTVGTVLTLGQEGNWIEAVTSRKSTTTQITQEWLTNYFPNCFRALSFTHAYDKRLKTKSKGKICWERGLDVLIDDNAEHCTSAIELGKRAILFGEYGWNRTNSDPRILRASNWQEVYDHIKSMQ
jgi:uncharacterized HAD superfamily protein